MTVLGIPILTLIIFLPLAGVVVLLFLPKEKAVVLRTAALIFSLLNFIFSLPLFFKFQSDKVGMQFVENVPWIKAYGISYFIGLDGISLLLVLLTTFLTPLCILACWKDIKVRVKEFMVCLLAMETGLIGVFLALDLFLFYIFWEVCLIPMYLIIGVWGNPARRIYAAIKFVLFTMVGSLLMLIAILFLYFYHGKEAGEFTFNILKLYNTNVPVHYQIWMFLAFALAFAIKVPMFPFHTWLPDAHTEAPTVGSVMLAAVLLKMGCYGFLRFAMPLFPEAAQLFVPLLCILSIIGIIYGALVSLVQVDMKRLVAFSSVSHLGFCMLGIFSLNLLSVEGGIIQMINHGLSTGALFFAVGILYERRHTRMIEEFGGIAKVMPVYATIFGIVMLSSVGLPGLNGFIGEFLILIGTFQHKIVYAVFAATGVVLAAWYLLWMFQRVIFGEVNKEENKVLRDLSIREYLYMVPILLFIVWIGVYPQTFLSKIEVSAQHFISQVKTERTLHSVSPATIKKASEPQESSYHSREIEESSHH